MTRELPRFVTIKPVAGRERFYWTLPSYYRKLGCTLHKEHETALGADFEDACAKAKTLNGIFDDWDRARLGEPPVPKIEVRIGTVDWLFQAYKGSNDWKERVSKRTAPDHENTMNLIRDLKGKSGTRIGDRMVASITPEVADLLYAKVRDTPVRKGKTSRPRTAEKVVAVCRHAWKVVHRLHPGLFIKGASIGEESVWNPWEGLAMRTRKKATKPAATRDEVYAFAWGAIAAGQPEPAAAAVICFEWLQRPENVLAGYITWSGYRGKDNPTQIRVEHQKTGEMIQHPLEDTKSGVRTLFYEEAEQVLSHLKRIGVGLIMRPGPQGARQWHVHTMDRHVRALREKLGLPSTFTMDACRHGGMTELEEAELTDGQGRALSAHRSKAYEGYAKRTEKRALAATRKRHAHKVAQLTEVTDDRTEQKPADPRMAEPRSHS